MIDVTDKLSISKQCKLLNVSRAGHYKQKRPRKVPQSLIDLIDEYYTKYPFMGSRGLRKQLLAERGIVVSRYLVRKIMQLLGLQSIAPKPTGTVRNKKHPVYPYLLNDITTIKTNQVWVSDITYIRIRGGFLYLSVIMDWASRKILAWKLSNSMDTLLVTQPLEEALRKYPKPQIFNTDQGAQYTSQEFTNILKEEEIRISMDGKGRWMDNVMVERFWRTIKYEEIYPKRYENPKEAREGIKNYITFYNGTRCHSSLEDKTPNHWFYNSTVLKALAA
jgi:putative transposase